MKLTIISALLLSTLVGACKSPSNNSKKSASASADSAEESSSEDLGEDAVSEDGDAAAEESVKGVMAADLSRALVADAGMEQADVDELINAGNFAVSLVSGSVASDAASFLSGVLGALNSSTIKIPDIKLVLRTIGSSVTTSVLALAGSQNEFELGGVPDLAKPEVLEALKAMFGNGLSRLPAADKIAYIYELIQGMMNAINGSGEKLSTAQFTGIQGSLSSGILASAGSGLKVEELASLVGETTRGMVSGSALVKDFSSANLGDLSKAVSDGAIKGVGSISGFDFANIGSIAKSATGGLIKGAGSIPSVDLKTLESIAKSSSLGLFGAAKAIPGFDSKYLAVIGSSSLSGLLEEAGKLSGFDKAGLAALAKSAAEGLMNGAANFGKLDSAAIIAIATSAIEGAAVALKNLDMLTSIDLIGKIIVALKEGLKAGAGSIPGFDLSKLDALPSSITDILGSILK